MGSEEVAGEELIIPSGRLVVLPFTRISQGSSAPNTNVDIQQQESNLSKKYVIYKIAIQ